MIYNPFLALFTENFKTDHPKIDESKNPTDKNQKTRAKKDLKLINRPPLGSFIKMVVAFDLFILVSPDVLRVKRIHGKKSTCL